MDTESIINQNKEVYNGIASHFSDTRSFLWEDLVFLKQYVKSGDSVLDVGCGNGRLYQLFEKKSSSREQGTVSFTGIDISDGLIKIARENNPECKFVVGDMRKLSFGDGSFDVVYSLVAFHHLPDHESQLQALSEMKRVLKPGGKIVLLNWNAYSVWVKEKIEKGDYEDLGNNLFKVPWKKQNKMVEGDRIYYGFTLEELEGLFKEVGLKLEEQYFLRHAEKVGVEQGMNIVSVVSV